MSPLSGSSAAPSREDLDLYAEIYTNDPYERENILTDTDYAERCVRLATAPRRWLELGLGRGARLRRISENSESVLALDGSPEIVSRHQGQYPNVRIELTYFEDFETTERFQNIGMGFILEHVDDPRALLRKYRGMLAEGGSIFAAVPNASSLHRLLGHRAGFLPDLHLLSANDQRFGHKRFLTCAEWRAVFESEGLRIDRVEGLYLKPFTTTQMEKLELDPQVYRALLDIGRELPEIANSCLFVLK